MLLDERTESWEGVIINKFPDRYSALTHWTGTTGSTAAAAAATATTTTSSAAAEAQKGLYLRSYPYRRYNKLILVSF